MSLGLLQAKLIKELLLKNTIKLPELLKYEWLKLLTAL